MAAYNTAKTIKQILVQEDSMTSGNLPINDNSVEKKKKKSESGPQILCVRLKKQTHIHRIWKMIYLGKAMKAQNSFRLVAFFFFWPGLYLIMSISCYLCSQKSLKAVLPWPGNVLTFLKCYAIPSLAYLYMSSTTALGDYTS